MMGLSALANATGNNLMGWSFQLLHSYGPALVVMEVLLAFAVVVQATMGAYRYPAVKPLKVPKPQEAAIAR
jgi:hypothetical protein